MRVVAGSQPGLSRRWRQGVATLAEGRIAFRSYLPPGIRVYRPFSSPTLFDVAWIARKPRRPSLGELWSLDADTDIFTVSTADARLEWALLAVQREWALNLVAR
jgi:hypothetical protein